jgi:hypothetical protein
MAIERDLFLRRWRGRYVRTKNSVLLSKYMSVQPCIFPASRGDTERKTGNNSRIFFTAPINKRITREKKNIGLRAVLLLVKNLSSNWAILREEEICFLQEIGAFKRRKNDSRSLISLQYLTFVNIRSREHYNSLLSLLTSWCDRILLQGFGCMKIMLILSIGFLLDECFSFSLVHKNSDHLSGRASIGW